VRAETLAAQGAVSEAVVAEMALGASVAAKPKSPLPSAAWPDPAAAAPRSLSGPSVSPGPGPRGGSSQDISTSTAIAMPSGAARCRRRSTVWSSGSATLAERWFFAIWPDDAVRAALASRLPELLAVGVRPTHPSDFHLTLAFLGPLAPDVLGCAERAADRIRAHGFDLELDRVGRFARARVLWCAPASTPEPLAVLVSDLQAALHLRSRRRSRPYRPHITLARVRAAAGVRVVDADPVVGPRARVGRRIRGSGAALSGASSVGVGLVSHRPWSVQALRACDPGNLKALQTRRGTMPCDVCRFAMR
jgi:RNA 2',3'-cyclic 3'-phosphodiesterase